MNPAPPVTTTFTLPVARWSPRKPSGVHADAMEIDAPCGNMSGWQNPASMTSTSDWRRTSPASGSGRAPPGDAPTSRSTTTRWTLPTTPSPPVRRPWIFPPVQDLLITIMRRLDWIDACLNTLPPAPGSVAGSGAVAEEILDRLTGLEARLDALGDTGAALPEAPLPSDPAMRAMQGSMSDVLDSSVAGNEQLKAQRRQLRQLTDAIQELQRRLGV